MKKIFLSLIIFNFFNLSAMEFDPIFQEKTTDDHIKSAFNYISNKPNPEIESENLYIFFHALTIIKAIIFLQKYFPKQIPFDEIETTRNELTKQANSWLIKKHKDSTAEDFLRYCKDTNESLRTIARDEENPILKKAFMPEEISEITMFPINLTILHWAAIFGLEEMVLYLLDQTTCNPNGSEEVSIHTKSPLYYCVFNGLSRATKKLLELGANPEGATIRIYSENITSKPNEVTAPPWITTSHQAVLWPNKPELLSTLIEHKVDTNLDSGKTNITINNTIYTISGNPLEWANQIENHKAIEVLQSYSPSVKYIGAVPFEFYPINWSCTLL